jgi:hypothetical protein
MHTGGLVGEYPRVPCPLQRRQLQVRVLVLGGDATVINVHAPILTAIYDARKPLFLWG